MRLQTSNAPRRPICLLLLFIVLAATLTSYMRWWLGYPICGTDEQNYLQIFAWLDRGGVWPISGPGYAQLILHLREWTGWDTQTLVVGVAALNSSVILPLGLWLWYRMSLGDGVGGAASRNLRAWQCFPWLFSASYFIAPWLEGRPQQIGMLLVAVGAWLAHRDLRERGRCGAVFFLLWVLCFGYHALSFVVLTALAFGFWAFHFVRGSTGYIALLTLLLGLIACLALGAVWYPLIWFDIHSNHIRGMPVMVFFGALLLIGIGCWLVLRRLRHAELQANFAQWLRIGFAMPLLHWLGAGLVVGALFWQYAWLGDIYQGVNPLLIAWYQGGNVLLATLFFLGLWRLLTQAPALELTFFVESCLIIMALGGIFLLLTPWLRDQNWTIRLMSYWVWYAAPISAWGWLGLPQPWRYTLLLLSLILLSGAVGHVVYAPTWNCQVH